MVGDSVGGATSASGVKSGAAAVISMLGCVKAGAAAVVSMLGCVGGAEGPVFELKGEKSASQS